MADDLSNRGRADGQRIAMQEKHEVAYWTRELNVSKEELAAAVAAVGNMAKDVRAHLGK